MRVGSRVVILATAIFAVTVPAAATTFEPITVEELTRASDLVVLGRVERVEARMGGPSGQPGIHTRARIAVHETLRGTAPSHVDVWAQGGRIGNRIRVVQGQATFCRGEEIGLFLFESGGGLWPTGMGRGKWSVEPEGPTWPTVPLVPGTSGPVLGLAELRTRVRAADERARVGERAQ